MKWKRLRRQAVSLEQAPLSGISTPPPYQILDSALQHLNNALNKNRKIQEAYLLVRKTKNSIRSQEIKSIYKEITQNRANSLLFAKCKEKLISQNLQKQEALVRAYRRAIQGCVSKIACFYQLQSSLAFCSPQTNELMRLVQKCSNKAKKITNLDIFSKMIAVIFDENQLLQGRIFESLLDRGYIVSMEEFYKINGFGRQNPDLLEGNGVIPQEDQQNEPQTNQYEKVEQLVHQPVIKNKRNQMKTVDLSKRPRRECRKLSISPFDSSQAQTINNNCYKIKNFFSQLVKSEGLKKFYPQNQEKSQKAQKTDKQVINRGIKKKPSRFTSLISTIKSVESGDQRMSANLIDLIQSADNHLNHNYSGFSDMKYSPTNSIQKSIKRVIRKSYVGGYIGGLEKINNNKYEVVNFEEIKPQTKSQKKSVKDQKNEEGYSIINGIGPFLEIGQINFSKRKNEKNLTSPTSPGNKRDSKMTYSQLFNTKNQQKKSSSCQTGILNIKLVNGNSFERKSDQSLFNNHIISSKLSRQKLLRAYGHQGRHQLLISQLDQELKEIFQMNMMAQLFQQSQQQNRQIKPDTDILIAKKCKKYGEFEQCQGDTQSLLKNKSRQKQNIISKLLNQLQSQQCTNKKLFQKQPQKGFSKYVRNKIVTVDLNDVFEQFQQTKKKSEEQVFNQNTKTQLNFFKTLLINRKKRKPGKLKSQRSFKTYQSKLSIYNTYDTRRKLIIR